MKAWFKSLICKKTLAVNITCSARYVNSRLFNRAYVHQDEELFALKGLEAKPIASALTRRLSRNR
jgi:hypothetical protein